MGQFGEDVERGGFQGFHARERNQLLAHHPLQVRSLTFDPALNTFFIVGDAVAWNSAVQFTTYEQLKKVC